MERATAAWGRAGVLRSGQRGVLVKLQKFTKLIVPGPLPFPPICSEAGSVSLEVGAQEREFGVLEKLASWRLRAGGRLNRLAISS